MDTRAHGELLARQDGARITVPEPCELAGVRKELEGRWGAARLRRCRRSRTR